MKLKTLIRNHLRRTNRSQNDLAKSLGLDPDIFRAHLARNAFYDEEVKALAKVLGKSRADLADTHSVIKRRDRFETPIARARKSVDRQINAVGGGLPRTIMELYKQMTSSDLVVHASFNSPQIELTSRGWAGGQDPIGYHIVRAVNAGAIFLYLRPEDRFIKKLTSEASGLSTYLSRVNAREQFDLIRTRGRRAATELGLRTDVLESRLLLREVAFTAASWCPFFAWNMRFGLYSQLAQTGDRLIELFASFPFGGVQDKSLLLYADHDTRDAFVEYLVYYLSDTGESEPPLREILCRLG